MQTMRYVTAVLVAALMHCGSSFAARESDARIERVENGLRPHGWAFFGDEERFNILERMKFYKAPFETMENVL